VMSKVWKAVGRATREVDVQLFATTHSWECVRAAHEAFDTDDTYDFMLHRLDRVEDKVSVMSYDRETLAAAFKNDLEVR
ncbi:MAG: ATPase, partial [Bacteroidota bacterium]